MVWIRYSDYGKQKKKKTLAKPKKKSKPRIEPKVKVIPGDHKVEFKKASELKSTILRSRAEKIIEDIDSGKIKTTRYKNSEEFLKHIQDSK